MGSPVLIERGPNVLIGTGSRCFFVIASDELVRAETPEERPEAKVVRRLILEAIAFVVVTFGAKVVKCPVAEVLFISEVLAFDPKIPPLPLPPKIAKRAAPAAAKTSASAAGGLSMSAG